MAITLPQPGNDIDAVAFGQPVANQLNALVPTVWYNPVYSNGWSGLTVNSIQPTQYRKIGDIVYLRGAMVGGTNGVVAFTLPSGFRPPLTLFPASIITGGGLGFLQILSNGAVIPTASNVGQVGTEFVFSTVA